MSADRADDSSGNFVGYFAVCILSGLAIMVLCTPYSGFVGALLMYSLSGTASFLTFAAVAVFRGRS